MSDEPIEAGAQLAKLVYGQPLLIFRALGVEATAARAEIMHSVLTAMRENACKQGALAERARIVEWLRDQGDTCTRWAKEDGLDIVLFSAAGSIRNGEHSQGA